MTCLITTNCFLQFLKFFTPQTHDALIDLLGLLNYVACIFTQPGPDLVKVVNLETSGPAHQPHHLTADCAFQTGIHARCKYLSLLLTLKLSNAMLLRNPTQIRCNENNFQFPHFSSPLLASCPCPHTPLTFEAIFALCVILTPTFSCQHVTT